jgi:D-hexose-6-phosphate mutarotase
MPSLPKVIAGGCRFYEFGEPWFERTDMPQHSFAGANTWVVQAIRQQREEQKLQAWVAENNRIYNERKAKEAATKNSAL